MRRPPKKQAEWIFTLKGGKVTTVRPIAAHCSAAPSSKKSVSGPICQLMPMLICQLMPMLMSKSCPTETEKRLRRQFIGIAIFFCFGEDRSSKIGVECKMSLRSV